jgi:hypothetical protein
MERRSWIQCLILWILTSLIIVRESVCQQTVPGCAAYRKADGTNTIYCQECEEGKFLSLDLTKCLSCQAGCLKCSSPGVCTKCINGLYLLNSRCESCGAACNICDGNNCMGCMQNYTYDKQNMTCHRCTVSNCTYCGSDGECQSCQPGFRRVEMTRGSFVCTSQEQIDSATRTIIIVCSVILCYVPMVLCCICLSTYVRKPTSTEDSNSNGMVQSKNPFMTMDNQAISVDLPILQHDPDDFEPNYQPQPAWPLPRKDNQSVWISQTFDPNEFKRPNLKAQENLPNKYSRPERGTQPPQKGPAESILSFY